MSREGYQLILDYEVGGGERYYKQHLASPSWPGGASGVTVGIGYDLGYNSRSVIRSDWRMLPENERLVQMSAIQGIAAKAAAARIRDILIAWGLAEDVFNRVTLARFYALTSRTFPGLDKLHANAQAALVSLIFNRGSSLNGPSRKEMRVIRDLVRNKDYKAIAVQLRAMKRLWQTKAMSGLLRRREAEARLVESCISI